MINFNNFLFFKYNLFEYINIFECMFQKIPFNLYIDPNNNFTYVKLMFVGPNVNFTYTKSMFVTQISIFPIQNP